MTPRASEDATVLVKSKQSPVLLLPEDEDEVLGALRRSHPAVRLLDASVAWPSASEPPLCDSAADGRSVVTIWNPDIYPVLPVEVRGNGSIWGPQGGSVVQWIRSRMDEEGNLNAGRWAASWYEDTVPEMTSFVRDVWRVLFQVTVKGLVRKDQKTGASIPMPKYRIGRTALDLASSGDIVLRDFGLTLHPSS